MKKSKSNLKSLCCNAPVKISTSPDFIGDNPNTQTIGTCCYICTKCNQACNTYLKPRKTWAINPATKVKKDERNKKKRLFSDKELKEFLENEDF